MEDINEAYTTLSDATKRRKYDILLGYLTISPKFNTGAKVRIISPSSPYNDHVGVIDKPPFNDAFPFWYVAKFESRGLTAVSQFDEEELSIIED
jgi:curved DNA-binding protein CbpA